LAYYYENRKMRRMQAEAEAGYGVITHNTVEQKRKL
jgi:hypothetical protein